jgi:hypothetical protein
MAQSSGIFPPEKAGNSYAIFADLLLLPGDKKKLSPFDKFHHETYQNNGKMM